MFFDRAHLTAMFIAGFGIREVIILGHYVLVRLSGVG
jgi:hypothetical protein